MAAAKKIFVASVIALALEVAAAFCALGAAVKFCALGAAGVALTCCSAVGIGTLCVFTEIGALTMAADVDANDCRQWHIHKKTSNLLLIFHDVFYFDGRRIYTFTAVVFVVFAAFRWQLTRAKNLLE